MHYIGRFAPFIFFLGLSFGRIIILEIYPLVHYTDLQHSRCNFSSHSLRSVNSQYLGGKLAGLCDEDAAALEEQLKLGRGISGPRVGL